MTKQEYIRQVTKQLQCARARKKEIQRQLDSHIEIALSEGRQLEEILAEMGDPQALAREFNENMEESGKKRAARGKILPLAAGIVLLAAALAGGWLGKLTWWQRCLTNMGLLGYAQREGYP